MLNNNSRWIYNLFEDDAYMCFHFCLDIRLFGGCVASRLDHTNTQQICSPSTLFTSHDQKVFSAQCPCCSPLEMWMPKDVEEL